nr:transcription elongation factor SPT5-like [Quercus suber]
MSNAKLDEVLSAQKPSSNKTGLEFAVSSGLSSSTASGSKTVFVPQSENGNKGYDEVFPLRREPGEDSPRSPKREPSTQSLSYENKEKDEGDIEGDKHDEGENDEEDREDEEDEVNPSEEEGSVGQEDSGTLHSPLNMDH